MIKTFTHDDVIRYIYDETSDGESQEIKQAIICDAELQDLFKEMKAIKNLLNSGTKSPSDKTVSTIINYSKSLNLPPKN